MDNPSTGSNDSLSVHQAAEAFSSHLDRQDNPEPVETPKEPAAQPKQEAPEKETPPAPNQAEEGDDAAQPATEEPEMFTVKIDGKEIQVPRDEVIAGYQRQQDSTRKTMEAAELRKQAQAEADKARQERSQYAENLTRMKHQLEGALQEQQQIDWNALLERDPVEFMRQKHLSDQRQAALAQVNQQQQALQAQAQAERQNQYTEHINRQRDELLAKVPEWKDEGKRKADVAAIKEYLTNEGYTAAEIENVSDHRAILNVRKAMLYDKMIAQAREATKKVAATPQRVERPGTSDSGTIDKRGAAFQRLSRSGRVEDAGAVFASLLS